MSSFEDSTNSPRFTLTLPVQRDLKVTVYDANRNEVVQLAEGGGASEVQLARGLYSVRVEGPTGFEEQAIRLDRDLDLSSFVPKRYSAAPIRGSQLTEDYYTDPSEDLSRKETRPPLSPDANSRLFIFARMIDRQRASLFQSPLQLSLCLADGEIVTSFEQPEVYADRSAGWWAFSVAARAGFYRLRSTGSNGREIGIHLFPDWQTQVFLLVGDDGPVLQGCRIFMAPALEGFHANDGVAELVDDSIAALADSTADPSPTLVRDLLDLKFENPVLGLIGAHLLIRANRRPAELSLTGRHEPSRIVEKLRSILGDCADVRALQIALSPEAGFQPAMFSEPPMLLAGFQTVIEAAGRYPSLIADAPIVDDIADNLYSDSVWTTWASLLDDTSTGPVPIAADGAMPESGRSRTSPEWVQAGIVAAVEQQAIRAERRDRSGQGNLPAGLSLEELAHQLEVTPLTIDRALNELHQMSDGELSQAFGGRENRSASQLRDAVVKFVRR
jgi:hypothetical protein